MKKDLCLIDLKANEVVRNRKYRRENYSPFSMIGVIRDMRNRDREPIDIFEILEKVSKKAFSVFNEVKLNRDPATNMCHFPINHLPRSAQVSIRTALGELYKAEILRKAKTINLLNPLPRQTYMINPYMIKCWDYEEAKEIWKLLTEEPK